MQRVLNASQVVEPKHHSYPLIHLRVNIDKVSWYSLYLVCCSLRAKPCISSSSNVDMYAHILDMRVFQPHWLVQIRVCINCRDLKITTVMEGRWPNQLLCFVHFAAATTSAEWRRKQETHLQQSEAPSSGQCFSWWRSIPQVRRVCGALSTLSDNVWDLRIYQPELQTTLL